MRLVNPLIDLKLFLHLGHKYNLEEDITLKKTIEMLVIFLLFLFSLYSLYTYQKNKNVV